VLTEVKVATEAHELDRLFRLRRDVFGGEGILPVAGGDHFVDQYDAYPHVANLVAVSGTSVVGGLRVALDGQVGMPSDDYFDFRDCVPAGSQLVSAGMFCLDPKVRGQLRLASHLIGIAIYWGRAHGRTHYCAPVRPAIAPMLEHVGFRAVAQEFLDPHQGVPVVPMVMDLRSVNDEYSEFADQMGAHDLTEDFHRVFADTGDRIITKGDTSDEVFFLVRGRARVERSGVTDHELVPGDLFGELALLTDSHRSADVVATTDCDLMTLPRAAFEREIVANPAHVLGLLRSLGFRLLNAARPGI
jgi:predicted GNAT family N-acyltransferase